MALHLDARRPASATSAQRRKIDGAECCPAPPLGPKPEPETCDIYGGAAGLRCLRYVDLPDEEEYLETARALVESSPVGKSVALAQQPPQWRKPHKGAYKHPPHEHLAVDVQDDPAPSRLPMLKPTTATSPPSSPSAMQLLHSPSQMRLTSRRPRRNATSRTAPTNLRDDRSVGPSRWGRRAFHRKCLAARRSTELVETDNKVKRPAAPRIRPSRTSSRQPSPPPASPRPGG